MKKVLYFYISTTIKEISKYIIVEIYNSKNKKKINKKLKLS